MNGGLRRWLGPALFTGFTLLYAFTSSAFVHWLDSGELALAGATLGIPHPPGHPGYVAVAHGFSLVPIGSVAFRTALFSGVAAALAVVAVYELALSCIASALRRRPTSADALTAAVAASAFGLSGGLWINAIRAEVYAMQVLCALAALYFILRWRDSVASSSSSSPQSTSSAAPTALRWAALLAGIGLTNHHYLMILVLPALLVATLSGAEFRARAMKERWWVLGLGAMPVLAYLALPSAAGNTPWLNFGDPSSAGRLWDVVSAKQFQQAVTSSQSVGENVFVALEMLIGQLRLPVFALAGLGWLALWREQRTMGVVVTVAIGANLASKVVMDLDPQNPDAAGYLLLTSALVAVMGALGAAWVWRAIGGIGGRIATSLAVSAVILSVGIAVPDTHRVTSAGGDRGTAALDALITHRMLPGGVTLSAFYTFHFNRLYAAGVEGYRSDLSCLQQGLDGHVAQGRSTLRWVQRYAPKMTPVLEAFVAGRQADSEAGSEPPPWPTKALKAFAQHTPVYFEPALESPVHASFTNYASIYQRWRPAGMKPSRTNAALADDLERLGTLLGSEMRRSREARKAVTLLVLQLAVQRLRQVDGVGALMALSFIDVVSPNNPYTSRLRPVAEPLMRAAQENDLPGLQRLGADAMRLDYGRLLFGGPR